MIHRHFFDIFINSDDSLHLRHKIKLSVFKYAKRKTLHQQSLFPLKLFLFLGYSVHIAALLLSINSEIHKNCTKTFTVNVCKLNYSKNSFALQRKNCSYDD